MVTDVSPLRICVLSGAGTLPVAQNHADFLKAPLNPPDTENYFFRLNVTETGLFVQDADNRRLEIDFDENHLDYQRKGHRGKNEMLAKALGAAKGARTILDLSVGMGIDSVFLSQLGFTVIGVERSPMLYLLLKEAFAKTAKPELKNYQLHFSDALNFLKENKNKTVVDSIYFDPMYPHKKNKSALPKQEMVVFRDLVGNDDDAAEVLTEALSWPVKRVVVKRPVHAPEILPGVRHAYEGKVVRYDTYVVG